MNEMVELYEQLDFQENPLYERIITDLVTNQYSIVDNFFSLEEVAKLRANLLREYEEDNFKKAAIGNRVNEVIEKSVRGDFILWLNEADAGENEKIFFNKINPFISYLNKTCFLGILFKEFHYALYPTGTFYKRHLDTFQNQDGRVLSIIYYLNEDWVPADGGYLIIYHQEDGVEKEIRISPKAGRFICFDSTKLEHEVTESFKERLSITGWLKNIP